MNTAEVGNSPAETRKIKVLFVAGPTRSGSTIISNILGQIHGFFHAGEVIEAWDRGRVWKCSCGRLPDACDVWSDIFKTLNTAISQADQDEIICMRDKLSRSHKVFFNHCRFGDLRQANAPEARYSDGLAILYALIQDKTHANIIIDSSKNAGYGDTLNCVKTIELYILHLVRDSRATAFSWSKKKKGLWTAHPMRTAAAWSSRNIAAECLKRRHPDKYIQIRYEDFIKRPQNGVRAILELLEVENVRLPFISSHEVKLQTSHGLCGNPGRFNHGVEKLELDNRWKRMKRSDNLMATLLTWPLLMRYNYHL